MKNPENICDAETAPTQNDSLNVFQHAERVTRTAAFNGRQDMAYSVPVTARKNMFNKPNFTTECPKDESTVNVK